MISHLIHMNPKSYQRPTQPTNTCWSSLSYSSTYPHPTPNSSLLLWPSHPNVSSVPWLCSEFQCQDLTADYGLYLACSSQDGCLVIFTCPLDLHSSIWPLLPHYRTLNEASPTLTCFSLCCHFTVLHTSFLSSGTRFPLASILGDKDLMNELGK